MSNIVQHRLNNMAIDHEILDSLDMKQYLSGYIYIFIYQSFVHENQKSLVSVTWLITSFLYLLLSQSNNILYQIYLPSVLGLLLKTSLICLFFKNKFLILWSSIFISKTPISPGFSRSLEKSCDFLTKRCQVQNCMRAPDSLAAALHICTKLCV